MESEMGIEREKEEEGRLGDQNFYFFHWHKTKGNSAGHSFVLFSLSSDFSLC